MFKRSIKLVIVLLLVLAGIACKGPAVTTTWKTEHITDPGYHKILVAAIVQPQGDSLRSGVETNLTGLLDDLGYDALGALQEFGPKGLARQGEAETYKRLCDYGIDAILTIALLQEEQAVKRRVNKVYAYPSSYYYNRIWNYRNNPTYLDTQNHSRFVWECILFNLRTLQVESVMQTQPIKLSKTFGSGNGLEQRIVRRMLKDHILRRQEIRKPF